MRRDFSWGTEPRMAGITTVRETRALSAELLTMAAAPAVMAWYYYGERALRLMVISVLTAVLTEYVGSLLFGIKHSLEDLSAVTTGVLLALTLPASAPWWVPVAGAAFAILIGKLPFGNARGALFSPAAVGTAFLIVSVPALMFSYPQIPTAAVPLGVYGAEGFLPGQSLSQMLSTGTSAATNVISILDMLTGNLAGPMGATCGFALIGALGYLLIRRPRQSVISLSFLLSAGLFAMAFPRIYTGRLMSFYMETASGLLLFSAVFFLPNEITAPKGIRAKAAFGFAGGIAVMFMRHYGVLEESTAFAVLIMQALTPLFDKIPMTRRERQAVFLHGAEEADYISVQGLEENTDGSENGGAEHVE